MTDPFADATSNPQTDESEVKRDRYGRYLLPQPGSGSKEVAWTRATTFCKAISDTYNLTQWSGRLAVKGLTLRPDLYALAGSTSLDDRDALNRIVESAKEAAGSKSAASLGTALHSYTEAADGPGEDPLVPHPWDKDIDAYKALVRGGGFEFPEWGIERIVAIPEYKVAGTFDRVAKLTRPYTVKFPGKPVIELPAGTWVIGDVKTGKNLSFGWLEIAIQLALYSRARVMWNGSLGVYEPMPDVNQDVAFVFHLPAGKAEATLYAVDISSGWEAARLCHEVRKWRKATGLATAIDPLTWEDKIDQATSKAALSKIYKAANKLGQWTDELQDRGLERLRSLGID